MYHLLYGQGDDDGEAVQSPVFMRVMRQSDAGEDDELPDLPEENNVPREID